MSYLIKKWFLPDEIKNDYNTEILDNLSKVNIFVGPNNSGKSWLLRRLVSLPRENFLPTEFDLEALNRTISEIQNIFKEKILPGHDEDSIAPFTNLFNNTLLPPRYLETNKQHPINIDNLISSIESYCAFRFEHSMGEGMRTHVFMLIENFRTHILERVDFLKESAKLFRNLYSFYKIYIPTLRGLRPSTEHKLFYNERTTDDYFNDSRNVNLFTGLEMYDSVRDLHNGDESARNFKKQYEQFLSSHFFDDKNIELTPRHNKDVVYLKIGKEAELPIYELGDGIQQVIIITYPLFLNKKKDTLAFIEEPELYLHPGLQRKLLEILTGPEFGNLQTFITTHSNHFLDMTMDFEKVSVFRLSKVFDNDNQTNPKFIINSSKNEDLNLLECLGVKNSSVMLTNCTIWVEGITDRMYIRKYLEIYQKSIQELEKVYEEDKHYSFVEYSGGNITHWSFLDNEDDPIKVDKLCGTLFLISDRDKDKEARHEKLTNVLGDRFYLLDCIEIENLLSLETIKEVVREYEGEDVEFKSIIKKDAYRNERLGKYIEERLLKNQSNRNYKKYPYRLNSGTIKDKVTFAKKAISHINTIDDLTDEAKNLCDKIYNFIKSNN